MYKITCVEVRDFARLRTVRIEPDADAAIILIAGDNRQGKTSFMNCMTAGMGGAKALPPRPVREGAEDAEIVLTLDGKSADSNGRLIVRRTIKPDGRTELEVREDGAKVRGPQAVLDRLIRERFLDPLAFDRLTAPAQRAALLAVVGDAKRLTEIDLKRQRAFDRRTEINRERKRAEGELARTPEVKPAAPIDVAALSLEARRIEEALGEVNLARARAATAIRETETAQRMLDDARDELARAEAKVARSIETHELCQVSARTCREYVERLPDTAEAERRRDEILFEQRRAQEHNGKVAADVAAAKRRADVVAEVATLDAQAEGCTDGIDALDASKAEILAAANLPVPGMGIDADGITLNGIPLAQASGAERLRVALGLAIAAAPELGDVWIRDGSLLDDASLAAVAAHAEAAGVRVWIERVGARDAGAIVFSDGAVVDG